MVFEVEGGGRPQWKEEKVLIGIYIMFFARLARHAPEVKTVSMAILYICRERRFTLCVCGCRMGYGHLARPAPSRRLYRFDRFLSCP